MIYALNIFTLVNAEKAICDSNKHPYWLDSLLYSKLMHTNLLHLSGAYGCVSMLFSLFDFASIFSEPGNETEMIRTKMDLECNEYNNSSVNSRRSRARAQRITTQANYGFTTFVCSPHQSLVDVCGFPFMT